MLKRIRLKAYIETSNHLLLSMPLRPREQDVQKFRDFFTSNFTAPSAPNQAADDVWSALENPIFKQNIFSSSFLAIIDHSDLTYKYVSPTAKDFTGYTAEEYIEKGLNFILSKSDDLVLLRPVFETVAAIVMSLPREDRMHFHLFYNVSFKKADGKKISIYQQCIPLALNDQGYPYLMLMVVSDITEFKKDKSLNYRATLNLPGQPIKILLSGSTGETINLLTEREKEIVAHLAGGMNAIEIADKLFISEGTVRKHRQNMLEKTGTKKTIQLVQMAVANGWVQ